MHCGSGQIVRLIRSHAPCRNIFGVDPIFTADDSDMARLAANLLAKETLAPQLEIATSVLDKREDRQVLADVRLFQPGMGQGCPACVGGLADREARTSSVSLPSACWVTRNE